MALSDQGHDLSGIAYRGNGDHSTDVIAIVVSRWNSEVTGALLKGAMDTLTAAGVKANNLIISHVPGSWRYATLSWMQSSALAA
jgi:6,7-dimethyl-8-ribityllumazine synthase